MLTIIHANHQHVSIVIVKDAYMLMFAALKATIRLQ